MELCEPIYSGYENILPGVIVNSYNKKVIAPAGNIKHRARRFPAPRGAVRGDARMAEPQDEIDEEDDSSDSDEEEEQKEYDMEDAPPKKAEDAIDKFWRLISLLNWKDRDEGANPNAPSSKWSVEDYNFIIANSPRMYNNMLTFMNGMKFWEHNINSFPNDVIKESFIYHIIARGRNVYNSIMTDYEFAAGFIGQDAGFKKFLNNY